MNKYNFIKYAPMLFFHPEEETWPTSAEFFVKRAKIVKSNGEYVGEPIPSLFRTLGPASRNYRLTSKNDTCYEIIKCGTQDNWPPPCYYNPHLTQPSTDDLIQYQYWFFYPYNSWVSRCFPCVGKHEGDWEHVTVEVNTTTDKITRVFFSIHGSRESKWVPVEKLTFTDDTHVNVYVARNSHANYPKAGQHRRGPVLAGRHIPALGFGFLDDFCGIHPSVYWNTGVNLVELPTLDSPFDDKLAWFWFGGRWGSVGFERDKPGPRSPAHTDSFKIEK